MPGFTSNNTAGIKEFLQSCISDLKEQNRAARNPALILDREIEIIEEDLARNKERSPLETGILLLIKDCYVRLRKKLSKDSDFGDLDSWAVDVIDEACGEIEEIEIVRTA